MPTLFNVFVRGFAMLWAILLTAALIDLSRFWVWLGPCSTIGREG